MKPQAISRDASHGGADADFKLLRYFSSASLIAFVVVAVLLGIVFRQLSVDALIKGLETEHVTQARLVSNHLWNDVFEPLIRADAKRPVEQLASAPEVAAAHRETLALLKGTGIFKIKVYDLKGRTVYSTVLTQIGEDKSGNAGVIAALLGKTSSKLVHENQLSTFEGELMDRDVVESYIPHYDPATGQVSGVFEIYRDATSMLNEVDQRERLLVFSVVALLTALYLVVFAIVKRAQNRLVVKNRERELAQQALAQSEERWKFALEGSGDGVWDRDLVTSKLVVSRRYKEIHGFSDDDLLDRTEDWTVRIHPDDLPRVAANREACLRGDTPHYISERRMRCKDGSWKWILSRGMVVSRDAQGKPLRMIGTHSDITERHLREQELQLAATVMETMDEAVMVTNADNQIISVNPAFTAITGYWPEEVTGKNPNLLSCGDHPPEFYPAMWQNIASVGSWQGEIRNRHKDGHVFTEWLSIKKIVDQQGAVSNHVAVFSNITERKAREEQMQLLAHYDALTELPNRALFADRLHQSLARAGREKKGMALMFIDLDKFKPVNDELGHAVGDLLLKAVAQRLLQCVQRKSDTVARIGGDEFVVLLQNVGTAHDAMAVAEKIRAALEQPFQLGMHTISIAASIGVALSPEHGADEKSLLKNADTAMYQSKDSGRNRVQLFKFPSEPIE